MYNLHPTEGIGLAIYMYIYSGMATHKPGRIRINSSLTSDWLGFVACMARMRYQHSVETEMVSLSMITNHS